MCLLGAEWSYEVKWDGIRAIITVEEGVVQIKTRSQRDVTANFPELCLPEQAFYSSGAVFDGEIVCLDGAGRPVFTDVMGRLHAKGERGIARAQGRHPAVCYLFDCLYLDGRPIVQEPLARRCSSQDRRGRRGPLRSSQKRWGRRNCGEGTGG